MATLAELKKMWATGQVPPSATQTYDLLSLQKIIKSRVKKHTNAAMRYFWASFVFQVVVYALLGHVIVKHWSDKEIMMLGMGAILLYLPFTIMLMRKFKRIAIEKLVEPTATSMYQYVLRHHTLLQGFYRFKKRYELLLIPTSCAIGTILTFNIYVPGGVYAHLTGAGITFAIALISCAFAIRAENVKSFDRPLQQIKEILDEFKSQE